MTVQSAAFVGTVGGAGTTRLCVELGATLARAGRTALVLDLDLATQGLAGRIDGRLAPDSTRLLTDPDVPLEDAVHETAIDAPGRLDLCPAHAPLARVAAAKTPEAAQRLADRLAAATEVGYDAVLLDVPPVASNPAIAAVTSADRVALVASPDERGVDGIQRARGRLADAGTSTDHVVATRTTADQAPPDADLVVPTAPTTDRDAIDALGSTPFAHHAVTAVETIFETDLGLDLEPASHLDALRQRLA